LKRARRDDPDRETKEKQTIYSVTYRSAVGPRRVFTEAEVHQATPMLAISAKIPALRNYQLDGLLSLFVGIDTLCIFPTGSGKTLVFTGVVALYKLLYTNLGGNDSFRPFGIVVSPLVNLMDEHVQKCQVMFPFLRCTHVSSLQTDATVPDRGRQGEFDLVWISPETLLKESWLNTFSSGEFPSRLVGVFYDEVHCVFKWGHDFRPEYLELGKVRARLMSSNVPIGAFSATVAPKDRVELVQSLGMTRHATYELSVNRPNIFLSRASYTSAQGGRFILLKPLIHGLRVHGSSYPRTLVYCRTKEMARELAMALADAVGQHDLGGPQLVNLFHAGICDEERLRLVADFASGTSTVRVLFASIALGMGQDLSQLYTVWAINPPGDIDDWMQMLGRGGRDGKASVAKLFFDASNIGKVTAAMREFCTGEKCLRLLLAKHFSHSANTQELRQAFDPNISDEQASQRCCSVCAARRSMLDPVTRSFNPRDEVKYYTDPA